MSKFDTFMESFEYIIKRVTIILFVLVVAYFIIPGVVMIARADEMPQYTVEDIFPENAPNDGYEVKFTYFYEMDIPPFMIRGWKPGQTCLEVEYEGKITRIGDCQEEWK